MLSGYSNFLKGFTSLFCFCLSEWSRSLFGRVPSRTIDKNRLQTALDELSTINTFSGRLLEICFKRNIYYNHEAIPSLTEIKPDRDVREIRQHPVTNKPGLKAKAVSFPGHFPLKLGVAEKGKSPRNEFEAKVATPEPYRTVEGRERLCEDYSKPVVNPISKICNLERRLAARRKAKIEKGMEGLQQPLTTKTRLCQRKIFNPSVISVVGGASSQIPTENSDDTRKTLYKKYLQLLPIDRALQITKHAKTINLPPLRENLTSLPKLPYSKHLQYRTVNSKAINQKALQSALKPDFLVEQTKEPLLVKENLHELHGDVEPQQGIAVKTNIVSRPCSTELVSKNT